MNENDVFKKGIFIEECNRRFSCIVNVNQESIFCYVASSSKLKHFINLRNRDVLLKRNKKVKGNTQYTLHAVKGASGYILLNLIFVNQLVMNNLVKVYQLQQIYREKKIEGGVKVDFYIEKSGRKVIIEAKGIITEDKHVQFPSMITGRAVRQLEVYCELLKKGYEVRYYIVLMNRESSKIDIDKTQIEFYQNFVKCIKNGMKVHIYKVLWEEMNSELQRATYAERNFVKSLKGYLQECGG